MDFNLIDRWHYLGLREQPFEVINLEVKDAARPSALTSLYLRHRSQGLRVSIPLRRRPVNELELHVFEPKSIEA